MPVAEEEEEVCSNDHRHVRSDDDVNEQQLERVSTGPMTANIVQ